jgi:calcium-dependent protein kinase
LKRIFISLDTSKDGQLSIEEIKNGMEKAFGKLKGTSKDFNELVKILDKDGNGLVDYTEFITAAIDKTAMLNKDNLKAAFQMLDVDNSGSITVDELKAAFDAHGDKDEKLWKTIMEEVDKNHDN